MTKQTFLVRVNWKGEIHSFHTTTTNKRRALLNSCHKLGKLTHISGNRIFREVNNTTKAHVTKAA